MNSKDFRNLTEAYSNIYEEEQDLLDFQDEDYEAIMTELVEELLDEGYELEESLDITEESFLDYIEEASVTFGHDTRGMRTPEERRTAAKAKLSARKVKYQKDAIQRVKSKPTRMLQSIAKADEKIEKKTKDAVNSAKGSVTRAALNATGTKLKSKNGKDLTQSQIHPQHKSVRDKAKAAIKSNMKMKAAKAQVGAYNKVQSVKTAAGDAAGKAKQSAKNMAARAGRSAGEAKAKAKSGLKGFIRKAAEKVASGASKVAKRMSEEYDQYDLVLEFLVDNEIAEDLQEAQWMMVNEVDSEDIATILEAYELTEAGRMHSSSEQQAGFKKIKDMESGGPGAGKVRSDDEIRKEKGGQAFLDKIAAAKKKMK